jgi:hypothetical protein
MGGRTARRLVGSLGAVALGLGAPVPAAASIPPTTVQAGTTTTTVVSPNPPPPARQVTYGVDVNVFERDIGPGRLASVMALAAKAGAQAVRIGAPWADAEPSPGVYNWSGVDRALSLARQYGLTLLWELGNEPAWDAPQGDSAAPPLDCSAPGEACSSVRQYVSALVRHASPLGLRYLIVRNEPQNFAKNWVGGSAGGFAWFEQAVYSAAHEADPGIKVLNGGTEHVTSALASLAGPQSSYEEKEGAFAQALYSDPTWCRSLDVLDIHVADYGPVYSPEIVDSSEAAVQRCNGGQAVPVWVTEAAYTSIPALQATEEHRTEYGGKYQGGEAGQAAFLTDTFSALAADPNVVGVNWTFLVDPNVGQGASSGELPAGAGDGLAYASLQPKLAFWAFRGIARDQIPCAAEVPCPCPEASSSGMPVECPCLAASSSPAQGPAVQAIPCCYPVLPARGTTVPSCLCPAASRQPSQTEMVVPICCGRLAPQTGVPERLCRCLASGGSPARSTTTPAVLPCCYPLSPVVTPAGTECPCRSTMVGSVAATSCPLGQLPPRFYGVNFDLAGFETFAHTDVSRLLALLRPSTLRWPGGTEADFYNWHTGLDTEKPYRAPFTLQELAAACQATGAVPVFDLNVLTPANRANPADQLAMLEQAQRLGLPVRYVEVGNELYANGPGFARAYPDGSAYARTVSIYVRALHRAFPGVKVAADAVATPQDPRQQAWDKELLGGATGAGAPDAYIIHFYPGLYLKHLSAANLPELFANAESSIAQLGKMASSLGNKPVWLTEYNFRGPYSVFRKEGVGPAEFTSAHELYLAAFAAMLPRIGQLELVDNWAAFADGFYGAWANPQSPSLTPGGQAVEMVGTAARGAVASAPVPAPGAPALPGGMPGAVGQRFVGPNGRQTAVLVNLTADKVNLATTAWLKPGTPYEQVATNPLAPEAKAGTPAKGTVGTTGVSLPPYSVTLVNASLAP